MSKSSITAKNVFAQIFITLIVGIAIGFFVGYPIGKGSQSPEAPTPEPQEVAQVDAPAPEAPKPEVVETAPPEVDEISEEELAAPLWPGRHLFIAISGNELDDETRALLEEVQPGGIVLLGDNIGDRDQTTALTAAIKSAVGLGDSIADLPLIAIDQEGGSVNRLGLEDAPSFAALGESLDRKAAQELGKRYAAALSARNIGVLLAPVLDVRDENTPKGIADRTLGDDNSIVTPLGLAFADGAMDAGVISVVKHYPGHGATTTDSHEALAVIDQNIAGLAQTMFPFAEAANRGIRGIMAGHIAVPAVDEENPELPASLSPRMLNGVLRQRWGYDGVIIADDINMAAITTGRSVEEAIVEALAAGNDAVIYLDPDPEKIKALCAAIEKAVDEEKLDKKSLVQSRRRLDEWGEWLQAPRGLNGPLPDIPEHVRVARAEAAKSVEEEVATETPEPQLPTGDMIIHTIEKGDTLSKISRKYKVPVNDIMAWNNLKDGNIKFGFKLKIYPDGNAPATMPDPDPEPIEEAPAPEVEPEVDTPEPTEEKTEPTAPPEPVTQPAGTKKIVHEVTPGQVLSRVAVRYGVKQSDIMAWSGFTDPIIKIGQRLTIYVPEDFELEPEPTPAPESTPDPVPEPTEDEPTPEDQPESDVESEPTPDPAPEPPEEEAPDSIDLAPPEASPEVEATELEPPSAPEEESDSSESAESEAAPESR